MAEGKRLLEGFDIDAFSESLDAILDRLAPCFNEQSFDPGTGVAELLALAEKIGEVSPVLASVAEALIVKYAAVAEPIIRETIIVMVKFVEYLYETEAASRDTLAPKLRARQAARARDLFIKFEELTKAGFKRSEALQIILAEASDSRGNLGRQLGDIIAQIAKSNK